jgi:hypothetical protein
MIKKTVINFDAAIQDNMNRDRDREALIDIDQEDSDQDDAAIQDNHVERDGLTGQGLDEDLHPAAEAEHEVEGRLLLDVAVRQDAAVLQLLAREDQTLLV